MRIPIFPLDGVIFFPNTNLPLNIFEPRYIDMVDYALKNEKYIGMIQKQKNNQLYSVGCLGKITSFEQTDDGRYVVNLLGQNYFTPLKEIQSNDKFRIALVDVLKNKIDSTVKNFNKVNKLSLLKLYQKYMSQDKETLDLDLIKNIDLITLVKFLAMVSPFSTAEKQMLLETYDVISLSEKLSTLYQYYLSTENNQNSVN